MISTTGPFWEAGAGELTRTLKQVPHRAFSPIRNDKAFGLALTTARNSMRLPFGGSATFGGHFAQPDTEDKKLRKDPFGGPCFEGTLRKPCCFPNEVPWPGRLKAFMPSETLDAGRARELQTIRPASHTTALGELFIADVWAGVQGEVYEVDSSSDAGLISLDVSESAMEHAGHRDCFNPRVLIVV